MLSKFKNGGERATAFTDPNVHALAQHVAKRYESALHACNAVDFDDLILLTLRLFREHPDALEACPSLDEVLAHGRVAVTLAPLARLWVGVPASA